MNGELNANCVNDVSITDRARIVLASTRESWSCVVPSIRKKVPKESALASTTGPEAHAGLKEDCFNRRSLDDRRDT